MRTRTLAATALALSLTLTGCTRGGSTEPETQTTSTVEQPVLPVSLPDITKMYIYAPDATLWVNSPGGSPVIAPVTAEVVGAGAEGGWIGGGYVTLLTSDGSRLFIGGVTPAVTKGETVAAGDRLGSVQRLPSSSLRVDGIAVEIRDADGLPLDPRVWLAGS